MSIHFPDWETFSPARAASLLPQLLDDAGKGVSAIEGMKQATFESLVWRLDDVVKPLWDTWAMVVHMTSVMNSPQWRKVEEAFQPKIVAFSLRVGQSEKIYNLMKGVLRSLPSGKTSDVRRRIVKNAVQNAERSGVALSSAKKKRFNEISSSLAMLSMDFANAVIDDTKAFKLKKGSKVYTIDDASYPEAMKHCPDRSVRERLFRARAVRAASNEKRILEILKLRLEKARLLGFRRYADYSIAEKSAPSPEAVRAMIDELDKATEKFASMEEKELIDFAKSFPAFKSGVMPWDRAYLAERLREKKYAYSEEEFKKYCDLETVLFGMFKISNFLFGIEVREKKGRDKPSVWHKDVRFFEVLEPSEKGTKKVIAHFYFDPFVRSSLKRGGAWMNDFRTRRVRGGEIITPLAVICTNFSVPGKDGIARLTMVDIETLFHEFGHALQCMLSRIDEEGASGLGLVEWDAVEVASQFMENWCLDKRTHIKIPAQLKEKVSAAKNFRSASACRRQLAFSAIDLELHCIEDGAKALNPDKVKRECFRRFSVPFVKEDKFLSSFSHIFAGGYAAGYYGYKWAEVMSADCFGAFEEAPLNDDAKVKSVGARYRETVLGLGGSMSALDVFKSFRGRGPEIDALLRQTGLVAQKTEVPDGVKRKMKALRNQIDKVDDAIVASLKKRFAVSAEMRELKAAASIPSVDDKRESEILEKVVSCVLPADRDTAVAVYEAILRGSRGYVETIVRGVLVDNGKVLLCRAKGGKTSYLPGGHIDFGETASEALVREMREECGVEVEVGRFLGVIENSFLQHGKKHCEINLVYEMTAPSLPKKIVSKEDWISFEWASSRAFASKRLLPESIRPLAAKCVEK